MLPTLSIALLVPGARSWAQSADVRADLEHFTARLAEIGDTTRLRRQERALGGSDATPEAGAIRHLRRGAIRFRLGKLGDGSSFGRAADDFRRATELEPDWTAAWLARGLAQQAEGEWQAANPMNLGKRVGLGSVGDAVRSLSRAIAIDPTNAGAGRALFDAAVLFRDTAEFQATALPALRRIAAAGAADTGTLLALARAERLMGDPAAGTQAARAYLERGGTRGLGLRELAWTRFLGKEAGGDSAYYAGAAEDDSASVSAFREDLALITDDSTLARFDAARGPARARWLRQFWKDRDREALRAEGERLPEHYRRLAFAARHFGLEVNRRHYAIQWTDMYRSGNTRFDDRGIVYIRYGPPDQRAATVTYDILPNETWRYHRADGDLLVHFAANSGGDIRDYRLIPTIAAIEGVAPSQPGKAATFFAFEDRCPLYPPFCKALGWGGFGMARVLADERTMVERSATIAVTTDGFERHFRRRLQAEGRVFGVGRTAEGQLMHVVFQVDVETPDAASPEAGFRLPVRATANFRDPDGHSVGWVDSTVTVLLPGSDPAPGTTEAVGRVTLTAPAGRWRYQIALQYDDSTGVVLPGDSLEVRPFDGTSLVVSDLVLSKERRGAAWVPSPGDTAYFTPRHTWRRSDTIILYHEIYGLAPGTPYTARLVLRKGRRPALTLQWEGRATGEITRVRRSLSFATVRRGDYQLEVEISDEGGRTAAASQPITVQD
jgi:GWxTD domain-containing protein